LIRDVASNAEACIVVCLDPRTSTINPAIRDKRITGGDHLMRRLTIVLLSLSLVLAAVVTGRSSVSAYSPRTEISTGAMLGKGYDVHSFYVRNQGGAWKPTYDGRATAGRLMNFRAANALFDDETRSDDNPNATTTEFVRQFDNYRNHGILAMTVSLQGGNPGYDGAVVSAFRSDGSLKPEWMSRAGQVIEAADARGMVIILTYFYQRQDQILRDEAAVKRGVTNATDWLISKNYRNVIIEIANEYDLVGKFDHTIISNNTVAGGIGELINLAKSRFNGRGWRLPVSASRSSPVFAGGVAETADVSLVHGNGQKDWEGTHDTYTMMARIRDNHNVPVVMNEDDNGQTPSNTVLSRDTHALDDALRAGGSWGLMWKPLNQYYPMEWNLGNPSEITTDDGYFAAILDVYQDRAGMDGGSTPPTATPTATGTPQPTVTTTPQPTKTVTPTGFKLMYSLSENRTNARPLNGATVKGTIYVFTTPNTGVDDVAYSLDGKRVRTEDNPPFDFGGGSDRIADPWQTNRVSNGRHAIGARLVLDSNSTVDISASFTIQN
jgi:hypothetical protein